MLEVFRKLKGRSLEELRVRGSQALSAQTERYGLNSDSRLPSDDAFLGLFDPKQFVKMPGSTSQLLDHFKNHTAAKFFAAFDDSTQTKEELRSRFSGSTATLIDRADRIVQGRFDLLGFKDLFFGDPIDWHFEPVSGKTSPLHHWSQIDEIDSVLTGDKKIIWELNRHQYFATLGRAYWLTSDDRYAKAFVVHLEQWMDTNPPKLGLNWVSSLEIAFRSISWLWGLSYFRHSIQLEPELFSRALKFLYLNARHLEMYLSTYSSPNTHLTGEALGLFYLGTLLPEFREAARWREKGQRILIDELERHVLSDGVYFERATYYHRYSTDFYTHFMILSQRNGFDVDQVLISKLQALLDHLMFITRPDGTTPFIGDDDSGQLATLNESEINDFRSLLSTGAVLFKREDYKYVAGEVSESTLWLLGRDGIMRYEELAPTMPASTSRPFPDGGYYVMRDGWGSEANYLLMDCGVHGVFNCGHAHADALSIELVARGRTMLVDPGTFTYTGSKQLRDYFRSSAAHNTLTIDGESSSVPNGPFSWKETANASVIKWESNERFDFLCGAQDGYMRFSTAPAMQTRNVLFLKNDYWVMRDSVVTDGTHQFDQHFHFASDCQPVLENNDRMAVEPLASDEIKSGLQISSYTRDGVWRIEDGWVSSRYGERTESFVGNYSSYGTGKRDFITILIPRSTRQPIARVTQIEATNGDAFKIKTDAGCDIVLLANDGTIETKRVKSNFEWAWVRLSEEEQLVDELVLINGTSLSLDGVQLLDFPNRVGFATARRSKNKLLVKTSNGVNELSISLDDLVATSSFSNPALKF